MVQAQEAIAKAHAEPDTPSGMAIIRQVYYPASMQIPAVRQVASYLELNNALEEIKATSFVDTLTARTSWILKPAEVRPSSSASGCPHPETHGDRSLFRFHVHFPVQSAVDGLPLHAVQTLALRSHRLACVGSGCRGDASESLHMPVQVDPTQAEGLTPGAPFQDPVVVPLPIEVTPLRQPRKT